MVALGTPHFSLREFATLHRLLAGRQHQAGPRLLCLDQPLRARVSPQSEGWIAELERAGITIVTDVCTYYSPAVRGARAAS